MIYLHFPVNYIGEYIPSNRQALFWGNKVYQEVDGRKYLLRETSADLKVKIPFCYKDNNEERLGKAITNNEFINNQSYPYFGWRR